MLWLIIISSVLSTSGTRTEIDNIPISVVSSGATISVTRPIGIPYQVETSIKYSHDTIDKLHVQEHITRRDIERSKHATWKTYFAEILAGLILLAGIIIFLCWWNCTKRGSQPLRSERAHNFMSYKFGMTLKRRSSGAPTRRSSLTDLTIGSVPMKPMKCPKPICILGPECATEIKGQRRWKYKEDNEAYGPFEGI